MSERRNLTRRMIETSVSLASQYVLGYEKGRESAFKEALAVVRRAVAAQKRRERSRG